jgi:predicted enzyme related to lactoylglutathione lyase
MRNAINWFEIPASDFDRAKKFYETILNYQMETMDLGGLKMGFLPSERGAVGGAICWGTWYKPTSDGTLVYLNGNPDLSEVLIRVAAAGGKVIIPKRQISPEFGHMAVFTDSEGNRVALHSEK